MNNPFDKPTWLLIQENGSIGEARTKALLLDRFWVLERSVDIEGADFIVEKQSSRHLFSRGSRPMALVQAKFLQDERTTLYIDPDYLLDDKQQPWPGFFLIAHSGRGDTQSVYLVTAAQVIAKFKPVEAGNKRAGKYRVPGKDLLTNEYVSTNAKILSTIERALEESDLEKNRTHMQSFLPDFSFDASPIMLNVHNVRKANATSESEFESLLTLVNDWKRTAVKLAPQFRLLTDSLETMLTTVDPLEAVHAAIDCAHELQDLPKALFYKGPDISQDDKGWDLNLASSILFDARIEASNLAGGWSLFEIELRKNLTEAIDLTVVADHSVVHLGMNIDEELRITNCMVKGSNNNYQHKSIQTTWGPYGSTFEAAALTSGKSAQKLAVQELINDLMVITLTEVKRFFVSRGKYYGTCAV